MYHVPSHPTKTLFLAAKSQLHLQVISLYAFSFTDIMDAPQCPKVSPQDFRKETNLIKSVEGSGISNSSLSRPNQERNKKTMPNQEQALKCPRCNSTNTKFCYYNNYNPSQPRYLCKACRRYWTHGGTLRNVPVGGTSRKKIHKPPLAHFQSNNRFFFDLNPKQTIPLSLNQDVNMGLYNANPHQQFLPSPSLFEQSYSQGAISPYQEISMSSLGYSFQDIVNPTLNLSMDGSFGSTINDQSNMEGGGKNPYLFREVKQVSTTSGHENVSLQTTNAQMRDSSNGVIYWNNNDHELYNAGN